MEFTAEQLAEMITRTVNAALNGHVTSTVPVAVATAAAAVAPVRQECGCTTSRRVSASPVRKSVKMDLPGFTDRSAKVVLRRNACGRDEFVVTANNQYRGPISRTIPADGYVMRGSASAQLKLGVLKITYSVYPASTSMGVVTADRASHEVAISLKSGR